MLDIALKIGCAMLPVLVVFLKFAPVLFNWGKNKEKKCRKKEGKKKEEGEFSTIETAIKNNTNILRTINGRYLINKNILNLLDNGEIFTRKAYLENKVKEKSQKNDFLKAVITAYITFIFSAVIFVLELEGGCNIQASLVEVLKEVLLWVCGFFLLFFISDLAVCYISDTESKRDEAYKYELEVIKKVLKEHMSSDYAVTPLNDDRREYVVDIDGRVSRVTIRPIDSAGKYAVDVDGNESNVTVMEVIN